MYKQINILGLIIWIILYFILIPTNLIKEYPLMLIGWLYTIIILFFNYKNLDKDKYSDLNEKTTELVSTVNTKAIHVATAIFALSIATKEVFKKEFTRYILLLIIYTLLFGVGMIIPIYFISSNNPRKFKEYNNQLIVLRNVFLSYSIGFMTTAFMMVLNRIFKLQII